MKISIVRKLAAAGFFAATAAALVAHAGWGTVCSFGLDTLSAICPLGALETLAGGHTMTGRVLAALAIFVASVLLLGRFFCGWFCPVSVIHSDRKRIPIYPEKKPAAPEGQSAGWSVGLLVGAIASSAVFGFPVFCLICPVGLTFGLAIGLWQLFAHADPSWSIPIYAAILAFELLFLRRWCHRFCPIGALMSLVARWNRTFRPKVDAGRCLTSEGIACRVCRNICPEGIDLLHATNADLARCTKCHLCADHCPTGAIGFPLRSFKSPASKPQVPAPAPFASIREEAARCIQCRACEKACPEHKPIASVMALVREGRTRAAAALLMQPGALSEVCGRVCPQERLCEGACPLASKSAPVAIGRIETVLADASLRRGPLPRLARHTAGHVAIVGAGPAGLACADVLAHEGVAVDVYEARSEAGGLLAWGIPASKLDRAIPAARCEALRELGVQFHLGVKVGRDMSWKDLADTSDAVLVACGAGTPVTNGLASSSSVTLIDAGAFLEKDAAVGQESGLSAAGKDCVVLGGSGTALDAALVCLQQGSRSVTVVCRRSEATVRASRREMAALRSRGAAFLFESEALRVNDRTLSIQTPDRVLEIPAGLVVRAFGFRCQLDPQLAALGVTADGAGRILCRGTFAGETAVPGIFCAGDALLGPDLVARAAASGKAAAASILARLKARRA